MKFFVIFFLVVVLSSLYLTNYAQKHIILEGEEMKPKKKKDKYGTVFFKSAKIFLISEDTLICLPEISHLKFKLDETLLNYMEQNEDRKTFEMVIYGDNIVIESKVSFKYLDFFNDIDFGFFGIRRYPKSNLKYIQMNAFDRKGHITNTTAWVIKKEKYKYLQDLECR